MPRGLSAILVVALIATGALGGSEAAKKELARLQGTWKAVKLEQDGKRIDSEDLLAVISGEKFIMKTGGEDQVSRIKLDPSKKPAAIDIHPQKEKATVLGIYKLEGKRLTICFAVGGKQKRPQKFTAPKGSGNALFVLQRVKK